MQVFDLSITLKCSRPSATRKLARCSTSCARGRRGFLFSLWGWGGAWPVTGWARPLCVSMSKTVETWILQERRTSAVAYREAGLPKNRVHAAKLSLSANPAVRYDAIGCDWVR